MIEASRLFEEQGNQTTALWMARKAYEGDAAKEEVYRALMETEIKAGKRTSAMQTYFACKRFLSEELGILPSQLTTSLYQELLMDSA
jgi:DNA-binding SARP family transcriptional activator